MRGWTLVVSILVHLCIIGSVIVAPLFATVDLPEPPRAVEYVLVSARMPAPPPAPRPVTAAPPTSSAPSVVAPDRIVPEPPALTPPTAPVDFGVADGDPHAPPFLPGTVTGAEPLPLPAPPPPPAPKQVYRVGGDIRPPQKTRDVAPRYPALAQASKVEGIVILEAVIAEDGTVQNVRVLRGRPLLDDAASEAVRQWRFTPPLLNGQPVPVVMTVTVAFTLH